MSNQSCDDDQHPDSSEFQRYLRALKEIDFELATDGDLELLQQLGLITKQVRRTVKTGREVVETIFSRTPAYIQLYEQAFGDTPIDKSAQTQRFEGFLFGYPPCCVNRYIRKPYAPNNLPQQEQKILFHWACRGCKVTPALLPAYKNAHNLLERC